MKKILFVLMALIVMGNPSFAQDKAAKKPKQKTDKAAPAEKAPAKQEEGKKPKLKKDGTPDMRHKENKKAEAPKK